VLGDGAGAVPLAVESGVAGCRGDWGWGDRGSRGDGDGGGLEGEGGSSGGLDVEVEGEFGLAD